MATTLEKKHKNSCKDQVECKLVTYECLPAYLKDNEFILNYYRCEWPLKQTLLSIFHIHNETLNIWTHLIGFSIFLVLTVCATTMIPSVVNFPQVVKLVGEPTFAYGFYGWQVSSTVTNYSYIQFGANHGNDACLQESVFLSSMFAMRKHHHNFSVKLASNPNKPNSATVVSTAAPPTASPAPRWPFLAFLFGAMLCLFSSSACHLLSCHSERCAYAMLRLDYTGISILIVTSFYPLVYYPFICHPFIRNIYIGFITAFGVATALVSLMPVFQSSGFRLARSGLFFCMGISGLVPILHKVLVFSHHPDALLTTTYELLMGAFYTAGVVVYVARVPERWIPGKFDIIGNSHQWFHLLVVAGAYTHYLASLVYIHWRDSVVC